MKGDQEDCPHTIKEWEYTDPNKDQEVICMLCGKVLQMRKH